MRKGYLFFLFISVFFTANAQLTGVKNIPGDYATIAAAVSDLNTQGVGAGGVTFNVNAGYTETLGSKLNLTATGTLANPIVFKKNGSGASPKLTTAFAGTSNPGLVTSTTSATLANPDGIWALNGSDYVTIDGIDLEDQAANSTPTTSMEYGFGLFKNTATDGCQNNVIQNCKITLNRVSNAPWTNGHNGNCGILMINASSTSAATSITPTAVSGSNSYNKFYGNSITQVNAGIVFIAYAAPTPFTLGDTNNDIGGSSITTGNSITNFGGIASSANPATGIFVNNQWGLNCSYNTIISNNSAGNDHPNVLRGIFLNASSTSASVNCNYNTITLKAAGTTQAVTGIDNNFGSTAASNTVNLNNNTIQNCTYATGTSATFSAISNSATAAIVNMNNNIVQNNAFIGATTTGIFNAIVNTVANTTTNCNGNQILNNSIGVSGSANSCSFFGVYNSGASTNFNANTNNISNNSLLNSYGSIFCIRGNTSTIVVDGNTISNNTIPNSAGATASVVYGYYDVASPATETVTNNIINNLSITGSSTATTNFVAGIRNVTATGTKIFSGNKIDNLSFTSSGAGYSTVGGILNPYSTTSTIFKNIIHTLSSTGTTPTVTGIQLGSTSGTTYNVYNNIIGNLSTPASTGFNLTGIFCGSIGTSINLSYNTVYLNTTSTGANFSSSAIYMSSTVPTVTLKNNIFVNLSTATGTGLTTALRRTATALTSYGSTSNNNLFYAGTPSASNLIYYDGTNADQTVAAFKVRVAPLETATGTENPTFLSTVGSSTNFLHIDPSVATVIESSAANITGITDDIDGNIRQGNTGYAGTGTAPDMGADEIGGIALTLAAPSTFAYNTATQSAFNITWVDNSIGEQTFLVYRSLNVGGPFAYVGLVASTTATTTGTGYSLPQTGLLGNTTYYYQIFASNTSNSPALTGFATTLGCGAGISGVKTIPGDFATITAAITAMQTNGMAGAVVLELQPAYNSSGETFPITFNASIGCLSPTSTLTIRPSSSVVSTVSISSANTTATIDFNATNSIIIDGRPGGVGSVSKLEIINTATAGVAVRFINDANNNTVTYCDVQGANTVAVPTITTAAGVIFFNSASATNLQGNDNNTISYCSVHGASGLNPAIAIAAFGTVTSANSYNDNCTITNCNIYDFFHATLASTGIKVDAGNGNWNITNNKFFQTAPLTFTGTQTNRVLWITPNTASITLGSGFVITGNYIGGSAADGSGVYTIGGTTAHLFTAMDISVGLGTATSIQNNSITNLTMNTASASSLAFTGINVANGNVNVGTTTGNTIGSTTTNGAINFYTTTTLGGLAGLRSGAGGTINFSNNIISGIELNGTATTVAPSFNGIAASGGTTVNISNNTIGSVTLTNSINVATTSATSTSAAAWRGIIANGAATTTITNNLIANINSNFTGTAAATAATLVGISVTSGTSSVTGNTIRNLSSSTQTTNGGGTAGINGIAYTATTAPATISDNTIHTLTLTNSGATSAMQNAALFYSGPTSGVNVIEKNYIHSLSLLSSSNTVAYLTGMDIGTGLVTVKNNMIRLGIDENGSDVVAPCVVRGITKNTSIVNLWNNSIYIGGSNVGTSTTNTFAFARTSAATTDSVMNNIFVNERSNAGTGGKHYQVNLSSNATLVMDYNVFYGTGNGSVFGVIGTTDYASYATNWVAGDTHGYTSDPGFVNATGTSATANLHIKTTVPTIVEANGVAIATVIDDFDGQARTGLTPTDIGADAGNFINLSCVGMPVAGSASSAVSDICSGATTTLLLSGFSNVPGLIFQWKMSSTPGGPYLNVVGGTGANTSSYTTAPLNSNSYFVCVVTCSASTLSATSTEQAITVNNPLVTSTTPGSHCGPGTVSLSAVASPGATLNWYAASTGGAPLNTGSPFVTPSISANTIFYVSATAGGSTQFVGRLVPQAGSATVLTTYGLDFTATSAFTLNSVDVISTTGTSVTISLYSAGGTTQLQTTGAVTVPTNATTAIPLNWVIAPGTYRLFIPAMTGNFIRENSLVTYPIALSTVGQINGFVSALTGAVTTSASYYFMYNWSITTGCESGRTPVLATISTAPAITVTPSTSICEGQSTTLQVSSSNSGYSYIWSPVAATTPSVTVSPTVTTKYYVDAIDNTAGVFQGCTNKDSSTITVKAVPTAVTVTPSAASLCALTNPAVLLTASGGSINNTFNFGTQAAQNTAVVASTDYPAPYTVYYGGQKMQMLILASELAASGFSSGSNLTDISFPVVSLGANWGGTLTACQNFQVSIGSTSSTTIAAFQTGLTQVVTPTSFTPVVGTAAANVHPFSAPFTWDGTSNIVIETTFSNNISGALADAVFQYNSPTAFQSCIVYRADALSAATVAAATTVTYSYSRRPDFTLNGSKIASLTWSPITDLFTNAAATTAYTGTSTTTVYAKPVATTTYAAAAAIGTCSTSQNVTITSNCNVPVTLLSFRGTKQGSINNLYWTTATELNNSGFELQRSADGNSFSRLSFVETKARNGNSNTNIDYSFADSKPLMSNNYYRLKQIDKDGKATFSEIVLLKGLKVTQVAITSVYPNPTSKLLNLILTSPSGDNVNILVTDIAGKVLLQKKTLVTTGDNTLQLDVSNLASGTYIIKATCENGCESGAKRFIKN